jgi:hypothetical protein
MECPEMEPAVEVEGHDAAAARAAVAAAAREYFATRRDRIDDFVHRRFGLRGSLRLHRHAVGWDIVRAPANIALAPVYLGTRLGAKAARAVGSPGTAEWLASRRILLRTEVARQVERLLMVELLELPWPDAEGGTQRDALAEAILASPQVQALIAARASAGDGGAIGRKIVSEVSEYAGTRSAVAEMTTALATAGAGAAAFHKLTPGMISLGPSLAAALAHNAAIAAFPLGGAAGSVWYAVFPAAASPALVAGTTGGLIAAGAVVAAFAGVIADPIQTLVGTHQRRLRRLVDSLEREFLVGNGPGFAAREHYVARVLDVADAAFGALRMVPR